MREIKFRAWHKADEKMYEVYGFAQNKWFLKGKQFPMPNGAVVIMQYTGLKDKDGKENRCWTGRKCHDPRPKRPPFSRIRADFCR